MFYSDGRVYNYKGKYIRQQQSRGYCQVILSKHSQCRTFRVHRLVAKEFIENPQNLPEVNHKDEDTSNNFSDNLEWCTFEYNQSYGTRIERILKSNEKQKKKVLRFDKNGKYLDEWTGIRSVSTLLSIDRRSIQRCCQGKINSAGGYIWKYK